MTKAFETPFYHQTIKRAVVVFGTVFNEVKYIDDFGELRTVPLYYSSREKFIEHNLEREDIYAIKTAQSAPRMGYILSGLAYAPQRMTNRLARLKSDQTKKTQLNRVPYDLTFELYSRTVRFEEGLKLIEQILPLFAPEFNVTANDVDDYGFENDYTINLNSVQADDLYQGDYTVTREFLWTLSFTVKAYLYNQDTLATRIKETIVNFLPNDYETAFERLTNSVNPKTAEKTDPHIIETKLETINQ